MTDIEVQLRTYHDNILQGHALYIRAADHIAAQDKRIVELQTDRNQRMDETSDVSADLIFANSKIAELEAQLAAHAGRLTFSLQMRQLSDGDWIDLAADAEIRIKQVIPHWERVFEFRKLYVASPDPSNVIDADQLRKIRNKFHEYSVHCWAEHNVAAIMRLYAELKNLIEASK